MANETIIPAIPSPKLDVVKSASAMKEIHEIREGLRGDPLDRFVSVRDMLYDDDILQRLDARFYTESEITATFSDYLLKDGTRPLTGNWDAGSFKITAQQLESDVAVGTAPFIVTSTTKVNNLNADYVDGLSLPNTCANVLSDHTKAVHDALGLSHDSLSDVSVNDHHAQLHAATHNSAGGDELNHDNLAGFVLNEHIDHTSVTITTTEGIQGGGDISANRTFKLDINGLAADGAPAGASDYVATYDASAGVHKKVLLNNLPGGGGASALDDLSDVTITGPADNDLLQYDTVSSQWVDRSLSEAGIQPTLTFGIADDNAVEIDDADAAANDYAQFTANGLQGRSYAEVLSDLSGQAAGAFDFNSQNVTVNNLIIASAGNIGSVGDTDAIAIAATGEVTLSQTLILSDVIDAGADPDKFLVLDGSNNVDYRTGAEVLSDIGAASAVTALTASAVITDHAIVRGDGGARGTQDTGITIDDSDNVVLPATSSLKCPEKLVIPLDQPTSLENGCIWIA